MLPELEKIHKKITKLNSQICKLQNECQHHNVIKVARADTGNWCKSDDRYWYDCNCPDCMLSWEEDR